MEREEYLLHIHIHIYVAVSFCVSSVVIVSSKIIVGRSDEEALREEL